MSESVRDRVAGYLMKEYMLGAEDAEELIDAGIAGLRSALDEARSAAGAHDSDVMSRASHTVKGTLINMGLNDFAEIAREAEIRAGRGDLGDSLAEVERLAGELKAFLASEGD